MTEKKFIRKGYKIWNTWKDEEEYELHYRYEVDDMCDIMNELVDENEQLRKDNKRLRMKIESLNENFNRLNKLFNEVEDVDEELMIEYMKIVGRTIDE